MRWLLYILIVLAMILATGMGYAVLTLAERLQGVL